MSENDGADLNDEKGSPQVTPDKPGDGSAGEGRQQDEDRNALPHGGRHRVSDDE